MSSFEQEALLWQGKPSHLLKFKTYFFCLLFCWLVFPILIALWTAIKLKITRYELTNQRLKVYSGVFNRNIDELELYRVRDYNLKQPFFLRLFGYANLFIISSDATTANIDLLAIKNGNQVREKLRSAVETRRVQRQIRTLDMD
ncbi:MAG: PH domain-containing protein [Moraxellaceae bacterium]|nr:MAG: PH domain-containing protein [Moraxellaceae bacterium]